MPEKIERDRKLGEELRRVIEDYESETGREVHAVNVQRKPVTAIGKPTNRSRVLAVFAVVKKPQG